jgi:hypothetical protein
MRTKLDIGQKYLKSLLETMALVSPANDTGCGTEYTLEGRSFIYYKWYRS